MRCRSKRREYYNEKNYEWRRNNPEKWAMILRNTQLKRLYGIDHAVYLRMFKSQDGKCKICGSKDHKGRGKYFHVDHNHETKKVRGLLCHPCNMLIAMGEEKIQIIKSAIKYLRKSYEEEN